MIVVTHSGKFHADDVLAWALLETFHPKSNELQLIRTRDPLQIEEADIVFDVGGLYEPTQGRFDHHQNEYTGPLSSAGMVLEWLSEQQYLPSNLSALLHAELVGYVDDVDNGRIEERAYVPCFSRMVNLFNHSAVTLDDFDVQFLQAANIAKGMLRGLIAQYQKEIDSQQMVLTAMKGPRNIHNILEFPEYISWKSTYFQQGGADHPTEFVLYPTMYGTWQITAIPPSPESFAQKVSFPIEWAGLRDEELSAVTGVPSIFCHKNRFIAVFATREACITAMTRFGLLHP